MLAINHISILLRLLKRPIIIAMPRLGLNNPVLGLGATLHTDNILRGAVPQRFVQQRIVLAKFALVVDLPARPRGVPDVPTEGLKNLLDIGIRAKLTVAHHRAASRILLGEPLTRPAPRAPTGGQMLRSL